MIGEVEEDDRSKFQETRISSTAGGYFALNIGPTNNIYRWEESKILESEISGNLESKS